ncbi:MAG: hypothetical protein AAF918_17030 [Pseudomonadota bacterium]
MGRRARTQRRTPSRAWLWLASAGAIVLWIASARALEPEANRRISIRTVVGCNERLDAAMRDLQADVTGPLTDDEFERIRAIFGPLCAGSSTRSGVQPDGSRRLSTSNLSAGQRAAKRQRRSTQTVDPVVILDLERSLESQSPEPR